MSGLHTTDPRDTADQTYSAEVDYIKIDGVVRSVERVDGDTILVVIEKDGRLSHNVFHQELQPNVRLSDAAFDGLERKMRQLIKDDAVTTDEVTDNGDGTFTHTIHLPH